MRWLPLVALALPFAAPPPAAAADPGCDTFWTALTHAPLDGKAERAEGEAEALWRYRSGATAFAQAMAPVQGMTAAEFAGQPKPGRMAVSLGLTLGDRVMTCYAGDAAGLDADYVARTETELPPETRAGMVARYRLKE